MRYLKQFGIIIAISFMGEVLKAVIPLAIPANIYGLVIMLLALVTKAVKLEDVKDTANFLIDIMSVMFIPAGVGLVVSWNALSSIIVPVTVITLVTTIVVMAVTGRVTQFVIRIERKRSAKHERND